MKLLIAFLLCWIPLNAADGPAERRTTIPAGAVQAADGSYRYTDAQGKKWILRRTPFGVARAEDMSASAESTPVTGFGADVKATEDGDIIRFERPSPFGTHKWQRSNSELNEMEQAVWNREKARAAQKD